MYIFKEISKSQLNKFNSSSTKSHLFQSSNWSDVKESWSFRYIGGFEESTDKMVLSCLILIRKFPFIPSYMAYIPRGFICDYSNELLLKDFFDFLNKFMKKNGITFTTIDPDIYYKVNNSLCESGDKFLNFLTKINIKVNYSKDFDSIQPGSVFRLAIPSGPSSEVKDTLFNNFSKTTKHNIKTALSRGLTVEAYDCSNISHDILSNFYELMKITGKRDNFIIRDRNYFNVLLNKLYPNIKLYMVKYSYKKDYEYLNSKLQSLTAKQEKLNNKSSSIKDLDRQIIEVKNKLDIISKYKDKDIYLSGAIYCHYGNKAWYLYGASHDVLRDTMPNYLMQWEMIKHSVDLDLNIYDFRGTPKPKENFTNIPGLYKFKKGFGGDFIEFVGEIYLIRNRLLYFIYKTAFPKFKELRVMFKK